eukprot:Partr_v1_DN28463_c0_g1_i2_m41298 putative RhoGEF
MSTEAIAIENISEPSAIPQPPPADEAQRAIAAAEQAQFMESQRPVRAVNDDEARDLVQLAISQDEEQLQEHQQEQEQPQEQQQEFAQFDAHQEEQILEQAEEIVQDDIEEVVDDLELNRRKIEVLQWMQLWLSSDNITLIQLDEQPESIVKHNVFDLFKTGHVLCRFLNLLTAANPSFVEQNLPPIQVNERTDLFASMTNLSNFVRTCELYFNIDRFRLFEPVNVLKGRTERPLILGLYFLKLVVEQTSTAVPITTAAPYAVLTFDQISSLVTMITAKQEAPVVAYDPRVVMSVQDVETFQRLIGKLEVMESAHKTLAQLTTTMNSKFDRMEKEQEDIKSKLEQLVDGVLGAFDDVSQKLRELKNVTDVVGSSAIGLHQLVAQLDSRAGGSALTSESTKNAMKKLEQQQKRTSLFDKEVEGSAGFNLKGMQSLTGDESHDDFDTVSIVSQSQSIKGDAASRLSDNSTPAAPMTRSAPSPSISGNQNGPKVFKLPDEVLAMGLPKEQIMRQSVLYEVIDSEGDYVRDLNMMVSGHRKQLREQGLLDDNQIKRMFSNLDELLPVNQSMLGMLITRRDENPLIPGIGDILVKIADEFMVYDTYCANYPMALQLYKELKSTEGMQAYLQASMANPEFRGLSLESFLIKPVQRICKYPLLLRELIKTTPKDHPDLPNLQEADKKIGIVVNLVNERTRNEGEREKLVELLSHIESSSTPPLLELAVTPRKIVKEGAIMRIIGGKSKDRHVALLSDVILISKVLGKGKYQFEVAMDLKQCAVMQNSNMAGIGAKVAKTSFELSYAGEQVILCTPSEPERMKWITAFEQAISDVNDSTKQFPPLDLPSTQPTISRANSAEPTSPKRADSASSVGSNASFSGGSLRKSNTLSMRKRGPIFGRNKKDGDVLEEDQNGDGEAGNQAPSQQSRAVLPLAEEPEPAIRRAPPPPATIEIAGYPQWRAVDGGNGSIYYCNNETQESSWYHPSAKIVDGLPDLTGLSAEEVQKIYDMKMDYLQKMQEQLLSMHS